MSVPQFLQGAMQELFRRSPPIHALYGPAAGGRQARSFRRRLAISSATKRCGSHVFRNMRRFKIAPAASLAASGRLYAFQCRL